MVSFVTGGTGFFGKALVRRLVEQGDEVRLLVRETSDLLGLDASRLTLITGHINDRLALLKGMEGAQRVFHAAALVRKWVSDLGQFFKVNVDGLRNVLACAYEVKVERVIYTSHYFALGPSDGTLLTEDEPRDPVSFRSECERSQYEAHLEARHFARKGFPLVILYPGRMYGPGDLSDANPIGQTVIAFLRGTLRTIVGDGRRLLNYVYVDDVVEGHLLAAHKAEAGSRYILGGENATLEQVFTYLEQLTGLRARLLHVPFAWARVAATVDEALAHLFHRAPSRTRATIWYAQDEWAYSSAKAEAFLGYTHRSLQEGLARTVAWLRSQNLVPTV